LANLTALVSLKRSHHVMPSWFFGTLSQPSFVYDSELEATMPPMRVLMRFGAIFTPFISCRISRNTHRNATNSNFSEKPLALFAIGFGDGTLGSALTIKN